MYLSLLKQLANNAIPAALLMLLLIYGCSREERGELRIEEGLYGEIDYVQLADRLEKLQREITHNPENQDMRLALLRESIDEDTEVMRVVGVGEVRGGRSRPMALQSADRAATVEAYNWIGRLLRWRTDPSSPYAGTLAMEIPGTRVVHRDTLTDTTIRVLVETDLPSSQIR